MAKSVPMSRELLIIDLLIVMYALCYQLQVPLEPFLVDKLIKNGGVGDAAASYARLQTFFGFIQMIGSLIIGALIDRLGLKFAFMLNFGACAASYVLLSTASTVQLLYLSKVPTMFMAGFLCAQTAVSKLTPPGAERVEQMGRLTMAYTIGGTFGPMLGGFLGTSVAAKVAVFGSLAAAGLVALLPDKVRSAVVTCGCGFRSNGLVNDDVHESSPSVDAAAGSEAEAEAVAASGAKAPWPARASMVLGLVWPFLTTKLCAGVVNSMNSAVRPLILKNLFGLTAEELGVVMSALFFGTALISMGLGALTRALGSELRVIRFCLVGMALTFGAQAFVFHPAAVALGAGKIAYLSMTMLLGVFQFPLATTLTSISTSRVPSHTKGTLVGIEHSAFALASMGGPSLGGAVLASSGMSGVAAAAASAYMLLAALWVGTGAGSTKEKSS